MNSYKFHKMAINKRNINNLFYTFITVHLIIWTLVPSLTNNNLPLDTIEALAWSSDLDWGFNKHPPASAFFVEIMYQIFGNQDWAYYLLSQIFVIISFFIVWKFSEDFFKDKTYSLISVLLLESIYFYNYTTPEFNVYISELPFWTLVVFYSWKSVTDNSFKNWFLLGLFSGIGFLSHYLFSYLLLSITMFFIYTFLKNKKFNFKCLIALEVFIIVIIPHLIWLTENDYITVTYGLHRTGSSSSNILDHIIYPALYLIKQIGILTPFWLIMFILINKFKTKFNFKDKKLLFLIFVNFIPIILIALTSLISGTKIKTMWMTPFYLFISVFFVYIFQIQINTKKLKNFIITFLFLFILSPFIYSAISLSQNDKRTDYEGKKIAKKILGEWQKDHKEPINIVLGNEWSAGNLSYHLQPRPIWGGFVSEKKLNSLTKFMCIDNLCVGINEKN
jgi:4-amino-4-deoxy-L-arabinose transferase-like glycosyltransferase